MKKPETPIRASLHLAVIDGPRMEVSIELSDSDDALAHVLNAAIQSIYDRLCEKLAALELECQK